MPTTSRATKRLTSRIFAAVAAAAFLGGATAPVAAGTLTCIGTVENVSFHSPSSYMIKLSSMNTPVFFCSPDQDWVVPGTGYHTTPANCRMLYATFLAAKLAGGTLNYVHFDGDQVPTACDAWPTWATANIRYFRY